MAGLEDEIEYGQSLIYPLLIISCLCSHHRHTYAPHSLSMTIPFYPSIIAVL